MNTEHLTPEDAEQMLNGYFEKYPEKVTPYEDTIQIIQYAYELGRTDEKANT